ncbi:MAG TPA: hypothetical protein VK181_23460 [Rhizobium sp.]|nr:hypothetical protein [Rhizobium sp.]
MDIELACTSLEVAIMYVLRHRLELRPDLLLEETLVLVTTLAKESA